ncbi:MAG: glucose-6-phosphate isomerase [Tissierellia bacterium]|nr:glucose-6-phosphate isomerase [Tissierellia bacterium]
MMDITFDLKGSMIAKEEIEEIKDKIMNSLKLLEEGCGISNEMSGWIDYGDKIDINEYENIKKSAKYIRDNSDAFVILGIGGSYLGAKAAIEAIRGDFYNEMHSPKIYYAGQNLSGAYLKKLIEVIKNKNICVIVISKSGTTLETALSFRIMKKMMEDKYKEESKNRIFVVTDRNKGALKTICDKYEYNTYYIPDNVGGRYSVITPVGLLPMAAAGLNIDEFINGLNCGAKEYTINDFEKNICCQYAAARNILNKKGKEIEVLVNYEPCNTSIGEWWKQLFGESEGKEGIGIFPATLNYTTDLHSMGQYVQEGKKILFETTIITESHKDDIIIPEEDDDFDKLNYISGKTLNYINQKAFEGTFIAHTEEGNVPGIIIKVPEMNEYYLGKLFYFFMMSCAISGYTNEIDPFTQPGVENYKKNMFKLLEKE